VVHVGFGRHTIIVFSDREVDERELRAYLDKIGVADLSILLSGTGEEMRRKFEHIISRVQTVWMLKDELTTVLNNVLFWWDGELLTPIDYEASKDAKYGAVVRLYSTR